MAIRARSAAAMAGAVLTLGLMAAPVPAWASTVPGVATSASGVNQVSTTPQPSSVVGITSRSVTLPFSVSPSPSSVSPFSVSQSSASPTSSLPFTGADVAELAFVAAAALGAGSLLLARARRSA